MKSFNLVKNFFLFLLTFFIIDLSPFLLSTIQPDSTDYLNFHPTRQTTYYILIQVLEFLKIDLIFFQKLFLSISIIALFYFIKKKQIFFFLLLLIYLLFQTFITHHFQKQF